MKKKFFYIAMVALALTGCSDSLSTIGSSDGNSEITIPADAEAGEQLIKFIPEMSDRCSTSCEATASSVCSQ